MQVRGHESSDRLRDGIVDLKRGLRSQHPRLRQVVVDIHAEQGTTAIAIRQVHLEAVDFLGVQSASGFPSPSVDFDLKGCYRFPKCRCSNLSGVTSVSIELIPASIRQNYEVHEWKHACAILKNDFPREWNDVLVVLSEFKLLKTDIMKPGGRKSPVAVKIDEAFFARGWVEKGFDTKVIVDKTEMSSPTHKVDCYKNGIALEIEWNNKDPFFDRDLNNFRLLFELRAISVGILLTRCDHLQDIFDALDKGESYGASTTHMSKLLPRIEGGGGGGCPIVVFGISKELYVA